VGDRGIGERGKKGSIELEIGKRRGKGK